MKSYINKFLQFLSFLFVINSSQQIQINNPLIIIESKTFLIDKKFFIQKNYFYTKYKLIIIFYVLLYEFIAICTRFTTSHYLLLFLLFRLDFHYTHCFFILVNITLIFKIKKSSSPSGRFFICYYFIYIF